MLQGNVDVGADVVVGGDDFKQAARNFVGIRVEEANPAQVFDGGQLFQKQGEAIFQAEIFTVAGGVLSDQGDFADARPRQSLGFGNHRFETARAELAAQLGNDAKTAGMIAAFGDFDVGGGARRGQ